MPQLPDTAKVSVFTFCAKDAVANEQQIRTVENILSVFILSLIERLENLIVSGQ